MIREPASDIVKPQQPIALLLKLRFHSGTETWLRKQNIEVLSVNSVAKAIDALEKYPSIRLIVLWLSTGGNTPEKMIDYLRSQDEPGGKYEAIGAVGKSTTTVRRRAENLGIASLLRWPEGIQSRLFDLVGAPESLRSSARARVGETFSPESGSNLSGRLKNLSATGALLEVDNLPQDKSLKVSFKVMPIQKQFILQAEPVRTRQVGDRYEIGVRFIDLAPDTYKQLRRLVSTINENPVGTRRSKRRCRLRVKQEGGQVDFFGLEQINHRGAWLHPRAAYIVPPPLGSKISLQFLKPGSKVQLEGRIERVVDADAEQGMRMFVVFEQTSDPKTSIASLVQRIERFIELPPASNRYSDSANEDHAKTSAQESVKGQSSADTISLPTKPYSEDSEKPDHPIQATGS